jgi:release factor glutamine methyltransferase
MTVAEALAEARALGVARLDAQQLLAHATGRSRTWLLAHDESALSADEATAYLDLIRRRGAGEPFAYLVGEREFHGLSLRVSPAVLVPRPDTETLVDWALELLQPPGPLSALASPRVLDLGTGSGAIALAIRHRCPHAEVSALDASAEALAVARQNAERLGLPVRFVASDWWEAVAPDSVDLAVSNPPYIAADDPHLAALAHEPIAALTPGGDGLGAIDRLVQGAPTRLRRGGWLLVEHGFDQAPAVRQRLLAAGFDNVSTRLDLEGRDRCSGGRWRG